ncbi:hypothetical protein F0562_001962, partial [Nyssa sinensis]
MPASFPAGFPIFLVFAAVVLPAASSGGVVDFPVQGTYDPYLVGLYFTRVQLGSPPKEFYVQIDTGSDVLW